MNRITASEMRLANFLVTAFLILFVTVILFFAVTVWRVHSATADHKAQLNRVIELLEKKP